MVGVLARFKLGLQKTMSLPTIFCLFLTCYFAGDIIDLFDNWAVCTFTQSSVLKPKIQTHELTNQISCELNDIVYLITCTKCDIYYVGETGRAFRARIYEHKLSANKQKDNRTTPVSKHFTGKGHSVRNMQFSILEWCTPKYTTPKHAHRRRHEQWWMWNIGVVHPIGINQFI